MDINIIYKYFMQHSFSNPSKIVVFDVDETLGYFSKLGKIWQFLNNYAKAQSKSKLDQSDFDRLLDLFPEFVRPHMLTILNYIKLQKKANNCNKVMIYTNNQASQKWIQHIITYFENKLKYKLFDNIICAFKIGGKVVEMSRTSHRKTYLDLVTCAKIPAHAQICFIDDTYYSEMDITDNVVYIKVVPYIYDLPNEVIQKRLGINTTSLSFSYIEKSNQDFEIDKIISKKIMLYLQKFFA